MKKTAAYIAAILVSASCSSSLQNLYDKQEEQIDKFVTASNPERVEYNNGSVRVVLKEGTSSDELRKDGVISFYYAGYVFKGGVSASNLFATNRSETADASSWKPTSDEGSDTFAIETLKLDEAGLIDGLRNGLEGVKGGEECYILFSGTYGYGKRAQGTIPAKSALVYHIWVESISNE
jgi:hypothetical protein